MNIPLPRPFRFRSVAREPAEALPVRLPGIVTVAITPGLGGANDTPFDRPRPRPLRSRYATATAMPALFRVHN